MKKSAVLPKVVFEDDYILVLEKPAGMVVNRTETVKEKTLQDWIEKNFQFSILKESRKAGTFNFQFCRSGIVHRLDKETSGLILVAKTKEAFENLQAQFKARKVKKKYLSLVHGKLDGREGEIVLPVGRIRRDREKFGVVVEGKKARTKYKVLRVEHRGKEAYSFLELQPITGRTHQIRVHLTFLGHPLVADLKYGGKRAKTDRLFCPRMFLHASYLGFYHPKEGSFCQFTSPLPYKLQNAILRICGKSSSPS